MSKGSPIIPIRIPRDLLAEIDSVIDRTADRIDQPHTRTSWILYAIRSQLKKMARSRKRKPRGTPTQRATP